MMMLIGASFYYLCLKWGLRNGGLFGSVGVFSQLAFSVLINGTPLGFASSSRT